jgi:hypothetical protein
MVETLTWVQISNLEAKSDKSLFICAVKVV